VWQHQARQRRGCEEVQLEQRPQLRVGGLLHGADLSAAGVVDEHVNPAESLDSGGHGGLTLFRGGDVERKRVGAVWQIAERFGAARAGDDRVTAGEGSLDDRPTEAARGARNQPNSCVAVARQGRWSS
jgi:hypothetical protein